MRRLSVWIMLCCWVMMPSIAAQNSPAENNAYAEALELTLHATQTDDPELAVMLSIRALRLAYVPQAAEILSAALPSLPSKIYTAEDQVFRDAQFVGDGSQLLTLEPSGVSLWDTATNEVLYKITPPYDERRERDAQANLLAQRHDFEQLLVAYNNWTIILYDTATGELIRELETLQSESFKKITFMPDNSGLVLQDSQAILLYDFATDAITLEIEYTETTKIINDVVMSPDGKWLVSDGASEQSIFIWDVQTGDLVQELDGHAASIYALDFHPSGDYLLSGSRDDTARVWNTETWETEMLIAYTGRNDLRNAMFLPDGRYALPVITDEMHTLHTSNSVALRDVPLRMSLHNTDKRAITPDGKTFLRVLGNKIEFFEIVRFEDVSYPLGETFGANVVEELYRLPGTDDYALAWAIYRLQGSVFGLARMDAETGEIEWNVPVEGGGARGIAEVSPDGRYIVTTFFNGDPVREDWSMSLLLHDSTTGEPIRQFDEHINQVAGVAFSPDNQTLYSVGGIALRAWNVETGQEKFHIPIDAIMREIGISPDGEQVIVGADSFIRIFDAETGELLQDVLSIDGVSIRSGWFIEYSHDGTQLLISDRRESHLFDTATMEILQTWAYHLEAVRFSPDGQMIATGDADGIVIIRDVQTGGEILRFVADEQDVTQVEFSLDSSQVITIGEHDEVMRVWPIDITSLIESACQRLVGDFTDNQRLLFDLDTSPTCLN